MDFHSRLADPDVARDLLADAALWNLDHDLALARCRRRLACGVLRIRTVGQSNEDAVPIQGLKYLKGIVRHRILDALHMVDVPHGKSGSCGFANIFGLMVCAGFSHAVGLGLSLRRHLVEAAHTSEKSFTALIAANCLPQPADMLEASRPAASPSARNPASPLIEHGERLIVLPGPGESFRKMTAYKSNAIGKRRGFTGKFSIRSRHKSSVMFKSLRSVIHRPNTATAPRPAPR
jgi:hypothetical protein